MARIVASSASKIVLPEPKETVKQPPPKYVLKPGGYRPVAQIAWAPAWFYSALNWLGQTYYDASNVQQGFNEYMVGSDVDPYEQLGSTRLFVIEGVRDAYFRLSIAADVNSLASTSDGTMYPNTDEGIRDMYVALSASSIFSAVKYCYIPGRLGSDVNSLATSFVGAAVVTNLQPGYDPTTGLRSIVLGSAVSQVVPLDDFLKTHNEQIYDDDPAIVPIVTALVYDVTQNNQLGAKTFNLPTFYTRDQVSSGNYYVNKLASGISLNGVGTGVSSGQTVIFPGGPGYNDNAATALKLDLSTAAMSPAITFTTYFFDIAKVVTISSFSPKAQIGVASLTYAGSSPATVFANQRILGFYRDNSWTTCLGVPIYDFGAENTSFTAGPTTPLNTPELIYDPTHPFLNGGSVQNVIRSLAQATYLFSPDKLVSILDEAIAAKPTDSGVGLSVMTAALNFNLGSTPSSAIVNELTVPVLATVTTTPPTILFPVRLQGETFTQGDTLAQVAAASPTMSKTTDTAATIEKVEDSPLVPKVQISEIASKEAATLAPITTTAPITVAPVKVAPPASAPVSVTGAPTLSTQNPVATSQNPVAVLRGGQTISSSYPIFTGGTIIGTGGNTPILTQQDPITVQVGLSASVPPEALSGTGITSLEIGTAFSQQPLGNGSEIQSAGRGTVINLMDRHRTDAIIGPFDIETATVDAAFTAGIYYTLSLSENVLTVRGNDGTSVTSEAAESAANADYTYVGAMVYTAATTSVRMYPKLQLTLPAPAIGTNSVLQGSKYGVRLTIGANDSQYDIIDSTQTTIASGITIPNPTPSDKSNPEAGDVYFGSFIGGASQVTVWSIPVFLNVIPSQLTGASFNGSMTIDAQTSGVPSYQLQITDSSLFVYSNINVDTSAIGSTSAKNVFLASAAINSSPDDTTSKAFAPCKLLMGLVRQAQMGGSPYYVFVPEDDSVVIGNTRYMLSVIELEDLDDNPSTRPYPPVFWPQSRFWQFANRHNPYIDVEYTGPDQPTRISVAQGDIATIGVQTAQAQEPMQMYLDTNSDNMTVWPIYGFPLEIATQTVDLGQLKTITDTILNLLKTQFPAPSSDSTSSPLDAEQVTVPGELLQNNPYTVDAATTADSNPTVNTSINADIAEPMLMGVQLMNLSPDLVENASAEGIKARASANSRQEQQAQADLAVEKSRAPQAKVTQERTIETAASASDIYARRAYQPIHGYSVYNTGTGEAYIIELVKSDLDVPNQLPDPTQYVTYDPYYVRVVFLNTMTSYNMSIIVPTMVHDQYGHFARQKTEYQNLLSKTNELGIGYMYSLYDGSNNFDDLTFTPYSVEIQRELLFSEQYLFSNIPYNTTQTAIFNPLNLYAQYTTLLTSFTLEAAQPANFDIAKPRMLEMNTLNDTDAVFNAAGQDQVGTLNALESFNPDLILFNAAPTPPAYFICRRQNWKTDCHLMQATQPAGKSIYLAFGGGDLVPFRLDAAFDIDKRQPAHMYKLTNTFADRQYDTAKTINVGNKPYVIAVTTHGGITQYMNFSIDSTAGTADITLGTNQPLTFPTECYIVGQSSTTLTSIPSLNSPTTSFTDTGNFMNEDAGGNVIDQQFQVLPYNNLVYLVRAVSNAALGGVGGSGVTSGLLVDTFVPTTTGNLALAQGARYKRSGLPFFGSSYTPTTMVDSLDTLDFTSITGETFFAPTIFIPIPEFDTTKSFVADLSNFLGQQVWTFVYPEIVAQPGATVNGVPYANGFNLDVEGKPVLSLQKLHFVYDPLAVMFTPNDLAHKYPLQPKQQILALTNGQIQEGICWRSANLQAQRLPPTNVCLQHILPQGDGMDRPNIVYSSHNRAVITSIATNYKGMSVNSFRGVSGVVYSIEESALQNDQTGTSFISAVSSTTNMLIGVLFDYDNNDLGTLVPYNHTESTKGMVFLNGYLAGGGYMFSSPDHFDVNDVLPSQLPLLEQITGVMGADWDISFYNTDVSLPRQFWSLVYDTFTAAGLPNYIPTVPPSIVDPAFTNRTRSLILSLQNPVRPDKIGLMDTYSSVVSASLHLQNGVTGSVFLSKKADRDIASIGTNPPPVGSVNTPIFGLPSKYDFYIFSRDHYWTLHGCEFELIDQGYAMCLVDDGSGTGSKIASYYVDSDGNYNELYTYVLFNPEGGIIETQSFPLKVTLGAPANLGATPIIPETPNNINPQDLVAQINKLSNIIYAAFGPGSPGQPPAYIPIQSVGGTAPAGAITGPPGFNGYSLNVMSSNNHQPIQITQIYSGAVTYPIAGSTTIIPFNNKSAKIVPFYGSISHGLDKQVSVPILQAKDLSSYIPRPTTGAPPPALFGGDGLGAMINTPLSLAFQGSGAIPPAITGNPTPGTTMKADDTVFYTFNAINNILFDSTGKTVTAAGTQYFIDTSDPANPIYAVVTMPKFILNTNTYSLNLSTTLSDGVTSRYTLVVGGKSYLFGPDNAHVTVDRTVFTFNIFTGGVYTVSYSDIDAPIGSEAPTPIPLTQFAVTAGGFTQTLDIFNFPQSLNGFLLGVAGRLYTYDPIHGTVTISNNGVTTTVPLQTGLAFASGSFYGYVIGFSGGKYTVNGSPMYQYSASMNGTPATYSLMTSPQMFTLGGNFYTFNQDGTGAYTSVTGNTHTYPVNPYQFSVNGVVYIINTNVQPNTVIGGGNVYTMTAVNTQFLLNGVQYTIALKGTSLNGATISGQFNITQGNVVVIENYVYALDTLNGQVVGNGTTYPLTTSGFTYSISTADRNFTVTTEPNATTVTIGNEDYLINNTTVVGDGVTYPILQYRTFVDGAAKFSIGFDGTASIPTPFTLSGASPFTRSTFTDGATYTVNDTAAFDGTTYYLLTNSPSQFTAGGLTYTVRTDGVSIAAGASKTYLVNTSGPLSPTQFTFGTETISFLPTDLAAFDGAHYYAITSNQFIDTTINKTYTISGNTAVNDGNSYEIFSNLGQGSYFEVPNGPTYYVNMAVAHTGTAPGSASGDIYHVFPITAGSFTIPLVYTVTVAGGVATVAAVTFPGGSATVSTLTASGSELTGGYFIDPVTEITYNCVIDAGVVTFIDSTNTIYPYPSVAGPNTFVASVVVTTAVSLAVDSEAKPAVYPILNNQFIVGTATYTVNVPVAYTNAAAGPYWPMINGRFIVPSSGAISSVAYTVKGSSVIKGYVISGDDEFSTDGNIVYTVNDVNVVKATNQATLTGNEPSQTLVAGGSTYILDTTNSLANIAQAAITYNTATRQFTVSYNGLPVTYTVSLISAAGTISVTDSRPSPTTFFAGLSGSEVTFTDTVSGVKFSFDDSGNNPVTTGFPYTNHFFVDVISGVTYYIDEITGKVEAISYLPETTQYAFVPANGKTYLIDYNNVSVIFPVISGANVNAGIATVGSDSFTVHIDEVSPTDGTAPVLINTNSFEINGNLYSITGTPAGADYSACHVVGDAAAPKAFISPSTFKLTDPNVIYTVHLDATNLPTGVSASFAVQPSRDLVTVNDNVYIITYNTVSTGSLLGQGQPAIPITGSSFTLSNPFDTTKAKFFFDDLNIYDAGSVVGQFVVYLSPTFFIGSATYTLDPVNLVVTDNNKRPFPLLPNPTMFSINGFNYVIDTNAVPHAIVGNNNVSPLSTDVTVENGLPIPNTIFTLGGLIYKYTEDASHNLLTVTGTKSYMVAQPGLTFKLDSSLVFTIVKTPPLLGNYPGSIVPIGTITALPLVLNLYAGIPQTGNLDFFMYKNILYTLIASEGTYISIQKSYPVYAAKPVTNQQQLAVFDLNGTTYIVTDGTTAGAPTPAGITPGTIWAQTAIGNLEAQFGLVYGFTAQPTNVIMSINNTMQFMVTDSTGANTLYDILYTPGANNNMVKVDTPSLLPTFTQMAPFTFVPSYPLTFETGGYNAFTTFVEETNTPSESFAAAYRTPVVTTDSRVNQLIGPQGDFSLEFWHSLPHSTPYEYHPVTYSASDTTPLVYHLDVDFEDASNIYLGINNTVMQATTTPPVFSSGWRHFGLSYVQPYTMLCEGAGFEVKDATNYNFDRDFSIAMTFSVADASMQQGLLYKGTGSDNTSPELTMSYRVELVSGNVTLHLKDAATQKTHTFTGPSVTDKQYYQLIVVKHTNTPAGDGGPDPYSPPFDLSELGKAAKAGSKFDLTAVPTDNSGSINISNIGDPGSAATTPKLTAFLNKVNTQATTPKSYTVTISVRTVNDDGTFGAWNPVPSTATVDSDGGLAVNPTGNAHLLIGAAYDDEGQAVPMGSTASAGNVRDVYLFSSAINREGINTTAGLVDIANATAEELRKAGLIGLWTAAYDPNGVVNNAVDDTAVAISTNAKNAYLAPLSGHELEGTTLYINGYEMTLSLVSGSDIPDSMPGFTPSSPRLAFNAGLYKLEEISIWQMARQAYQVLDDMFGRLIPTNEPFLIVYLSGSFSTEGINSPILPLQKYVDSYKVQNAVKTLDLPFTSAALDLVGCPAVARCGPLVTSNFYTPPGVALTVCDTPPSLTTYSVTLNSVTGTLAGEINEAYVYIKDKVLTLYAGKKVGDLVLTWVSQEQGDVQLIGYIEGAPPAPMANLTNKASYAGATSVTFTAPTSVSLKYQKGHDSSHDIKDSNSYGAGFKFGLGFNVAPLGFGVKSTDKQLVYLTVAAASKGTDDTNDGTGKQQTATEKMDESNKYTVKMQGSMAPYTNDQFMGSLNTLTTPSTTAGNPSSKTAILPNPNLGGFTSSNPPGPLPKTAPTEEKFGQRMFEPSPYGQAFVTSATLDVYQQTLLQTNTTYGFVRVPDPDIPRDLNIVSFRMSSKYLRPGVLDGVVGYAYNPATLPTGAQTYTTSTGQMTPVYDGNFSQGEVGHDASYMRVVEAYKLKKQIDQQAFNSLALYQTAYNKQDKPSDSRLTPGLDFYNEYVWSSRGGTQEVKHTYTTSFDEVYTTSHATSHADQFNFNAKVSAVTITLLDFKHQHTDTTKDTWKYSYDTTGTSSFDIAASFDGIETDTQMRYSSANDAHFVMNFNSMFNPNNQSGVNLVVGSDGLVYKIVPSVTSGAGLPLSDNIDASQSYTQPQPAYTSGNADGLTGALEPYDRPGKTSLFRTYAFFLQPTDENADDFWSTVIDRVWLANSPDPDADAMRSAAENISVPWRLLYRVTYSERFLPPVSNEAVVVPQITPLMAVPVTNAASDFLFIPSGANSISAHNPSNDIEANIVLAAPTVSGMSAGTIPATGPNVNMPVLPNNVIPFDLLKTFTTVANWGDALNAKILTQLITSALGTNVVPMASVALPGSVKIADVMDPVNGGILYSSYTDPNGLVVNVPTNFGIVVFADVNGNPIQFFDGKSYHSLQSDYIATTDGTIMYYIQPPSTYDQTKFDLLGDYDLFGHPGDEWRYYLVSGVSSNMTSEPTVTGYGPFMSSSGASGYTGFSIAKAQHAGNGTKQVQGYVIVQGILQWPHLNTNAETFADVLVYKSMSLLDTFPIGDPEVLIAFLTAQYPNAPFVKNDEINLVFARNIVSYFNTTQQALIPQ